jgi:acyl-CoA synthetase (AMP-forming)/AMP-acid ligase II
MTESTGAVTCVVKGTMKYESVGGPIPNMEIKVVHTETGSSLAAREPGEICLRGPQVRDKNLLGFADFILSSGNFNLRGTLVATSCRLTHRINVAHSADRPCGWRIIGDKLLVGVVR